MNQQPESCAISVIYTTFAYRVMYTMAEKQIDKVLGLDVETVENKGEKWIVPFAGYSCNHVKPNGGTWYDITSVG